MSAKKYSGPMIGAMVLASAVFVTTSSCAGAADSANAPAPPDQAASTTPAPVNQKTFSRPEEAVEALVTAAEKFDVAALKEILGPDGVDLVVTGDPVLDKNQATAFAARAHEKLEIVRDPAKPNVVTLQIGAQDWPVPMPIVERDGRWLFDTKAGREEILYRRIGANELDAIAACRNYVDAQKDYALDLHDGSTVHQYAQKIISTPGKQDGLYWKNADGSSGGPLGEEAARAIAEGYSLEKASAYHGYYFHVLKGQGPHAPLGEIDYLIKGMMIGGFALIATPADYGVTGIQTFIVSHEGIVYQKDLGENSLDIARNIELYDPDPSWQPTEDSW